MARHLKVTVTVPMPAGEGDAGFATFGPHDEVPKWAADQIGDHAWESGKPEPEPADDAGPVAGEPEEPKAPAKRVAAKSDK